MSTPLKPPPPYCTALPFHCSGKLTSNRIDGAAGSSGAISPSTLQYAALGSAAAGEAGSRSTVAEAMRAGPLGRPISAGSMLRPASAAQGAAPSASSTGAAGTVLQTAATLAPTRRRRQQFGPRRNLIGPLLYECVSSHGSYGK